MDSLARFSHGVRITASFFLVFLALAVAVAVSPEAAIAQGRTFYVDVAGGDDSNSGTSSSSAWKTIARANEVDLEPGDGLLFKGGQTFGGGLYLAPEDGGTPANPVRVGSYGDGRATLEAGTGFGVYAYNVGGIEVSNLNVRGAGRENGNRQSGVSFFNDLDGGRKLEHLRVDDVEVSGFGGTGVEFGGYPQDGSKSGYSDVSITDVSAHDNADAGIASYGVFDPSSTGYANSDVYVARCEAYNNPGTPGKGANSGSGIVLGEVDRAVVERNVAHHNGENNDFPGGGPVGIWTYESNRVTIQHNESYANDTRTVDGGGFDLDGGVTNSVVQYNYSHDNAGPGYLLYEFSGARRFANNTVRYNISQNDGRENGGGIFIGGGVYSTDVYNNTIYSGPRSVNGQTYAVKAEDTSGFRFFNNALITDGGVPLVEVADGQPGLVFRDNAYWSSGDPFVIRDGGSAYGSLASWRAGAGQERYNGRDTGLQTDPGLTNAGGGGTIGDADRLSSLQAYRLRPGSPLVDAGLDPRTLSVNPGASDFHGDDIPQGRGFDVGADEAVAVPPPGTPPGTPAPPPNTAPTINEVSPKSGSRTRDRTPRIRATVRDSDTGLSRRDITLYVDGKRAGSFAYERSTGLLKAVSRRLSPGRHTVRVVVSDPAELRTSRAWSFKVVR